MGRLDVEEPEIVELIQRAGEGERRRASVAATETALDFRPVSDSRLDAALFALRNQQFGPTPARNDLDVLVGELDEVQWNLQETLDSLGRGDAEMEYQQAFGQARAANALWSALDQD